MTRLFSDGILVYAYVSEDFDLGDCLQALALCKFYF